MVSIFQEAWVFSFFCPFEHDLVEEAKQRPVIESGQWDSFCYDVIDNSCNITLNAVHVIISMDIWMLKTYFILAHDTTK
jgi:hypothetical protein